MYIRFVLLSVNGGREENNGFGGRTKGPGIDVFDTGDVVKCFLTEGEGTDVGGGGGGGKVGEQDVFGGFEATNVVAIVFGFV